MPYRFKAEAILMIPLDNMFENTVPSVDHYGSFHRYILFKENKLYW